MIIGLLSILLAIGFWLLVGLALRWLVMSGMRELEARRHLRVRDPHWGETLESCRYCLYEEAFGLDSTVPSRPLGPYGDPPSSD